MRNHSDLREVSKGKINLKLWSRANCWICLLIFLVSCGFCLLFRYNKVLENIINNFLLRENSFIFESVEKRRIRGRYTIIGADPDKIWEFTKNTIHLIENNK